MNTAADIAKALGGRSTGGGHYLCPCPVPSHGKGKGDRNPSLSVYDGDAALLVTCFAGCDRRDVIDELRNRGLMRAERRVGELLGEDNTVRRGGSKYRAGTLKSYGVDKKLSSRAQNQDIALKIWREETAPLNGTLGAAYFTVHRHIDLDSLDDLSHCLRWHAGKKMVVARMTDPLTGTERGVHRVFLNRDGTKRERKMLGPKGVICLTPWDDVTHGLGLSEGIEDGLHIIADGWRPVWAAPDAGTIKSFPVIPGIESLTIFADADTPGMTAARTCAESWTNAGLEVAILPPRRETAHPIDGD